MKLNLNKIVAGFLVFSMLTMNVPFLNTSILMAQEIQEKEEVTLSSETVSPEITSTEKTTESNPPEKIPTENVVEEIIEEVIDDAPRTESLEEEAATSTPVSLDASLLEISTTTSSSTPPTEIGTTTPDTIGTTTVDTVNNASTTNDVTSVAGTGDNSAGSMATSTGTSTIITGDAVATANVVNVVNVNVFDSDTLVTFLDKVSNGDATSVDLRNLELAQDGYLGCAGCSLSTTTLSSTTPDGNKGPLVASTTNDATITNAVVVRSGTGNNTVSSGAGLAGIQTGDAYAVANVVNAVNSTFVDSTYLALMFNNFGDWSGDVVLPTAEYFSNFLATNTSRTSTPLYASTSNNADINNNVNTTSDTGNNTASTTNGGTAIVQTGDALSANNVINEVNETNIGGNSVMIVFRIFGKWSGKIFNLPSILGGSLTEAGVQFIGMSDDPENAINGTTLSLRPVSISGNNNATIYNNIDVSASSGNNHASSSNVAYIGTGDAYAASNVMNIVNTTSIGRNWMGAIVNIYGDWNGNISFGQPNLWIGTKGEFKNGNNRPGSQIIYEYTIKNNGDAPAHNVKIKNEANTSLLTLPLNGVLEVGTLEPGESKVLKVEGNVSVNLPYGDTAIASTIKATGNETDGDMQDNTDVITMVVSNPAPGSGNDRGRDTKSDNPAWIYVETWNSASTSPVYASSTVEFTIKLTNNGGIARGAVLVDKITDSTGKVVHEEYWDLGDIRKKEDILVTYTAFFSASSTPGLYTNSAEVKLIGNSPLEANIATSYFTLLGAPVLVSNSSGDKYVTKLIAPKKKVVIATSTETIATTTATATPAMLLSTDEGSGKKSMLASAIFAIGDSMYFYLVLLSLLGAVYLVIRRYVDYVKNLS